MPFTDEQRLKGLKKQLANLGYKVVASDEVKVEAEADQETGEQLLRSLKADAEGW